MSNIRSQLEKRLARLIAPAFPFPRPSAARPQVDLVYINKADQDQLGGTLRE